ncbi:polyadenylate-binding protein-interacting protein 1 isoform X2 [Patella vulgata]|uniref:polyadenylate-binding protein-interacting protein 1 isoform X2 n=1 Tax=Patella vulgata TaxID=6465 RepID=UPI00217F43B0|nr:polyadenylate-binding protein-interacting protein 1 isoform X2 [Patella vulgata]
MNPVNSATGSIQGDSVATVSPIARPPLRAPKESTVIQLQQTVVNNGVVGSSSDTNNSNISSKLSVKAQEFIPKSYAAGNNYNTTTTNDSHIYNPVMEEFYKTITILTSQPGNVEEYMNRLYEYLQPVKSKDILDNIINSLYDQCIAEPNFRYTGARICQHICKHLNNHPVFKDFRTSLLKRCKVDYDKRESLLLDQQTSSRVYGLAMFMSELFLNVENVQAGRVEKFNVLGTGLIDITLSLLAYPTKDNIKCAVQLLKLAGAAIEDIPDSQIQSVFDRLSQLQVSDVHENAKFMIKSVIDLRSNNWGRGESTSSSTDGLDASMGDLNLANNVLECEPVFFDAKGQRITRAEAGYQDEADEESDYMLNEEEELDYLQWAQENGMGDGGQYPEWSYDGYNLAGDGYNLPEEYGDNDPECTPEVMEAYEQYLKNNPS